MSIASITAARVSELEAKVIELEARRKAYHDFGLTSRKFLDNVLKMKINVRMQPSTFQECFK